MSNTFAYFRNLLFRYGIVVILFFAIVCRLIQLDIPRTYVFDEVYHAVTAKLIARNDPQAFEWWNPPIETNTAVDWLHPPYAKYSQAVGMLVFGENSFGWRISSAIFGCGVILLIFFLSEELFNSRWISLVASLLASLDGLLLVMSRVAMNDIHVTFFILLTILFYLQYRRQKRPLWIVGLSAGIAVGSKWSGVFILAWVWLMEIQHVIGYVLLAGRKAIPSITSLLVSSTRYLIFLVLIPLLLYISSYWLMFAQGKDLHHFQELHRQIIWYQTHLEATHSYQSRPLEWFVNWRPVWFYVSYGEKTIANIYAQGNPAIMWFGAIAVVVTVLQLIIHFVKKPSSIWHFSPLLSLITTYCIVWLPWQLSPRIMFYYHYTPAVPLLCIILAYSLRQLWDKGLKWVVVAVLLLCIGIFLLWLPNWIGLSVPVSFAQKVYFILPNWR